MMRCRYEFNLSAQFYDILFIQHDSEASVVAKLPEISQVRWLSDTFYCSSVYLFAIRKLISGSKAELAGSYSGCQTKYHI